jgi:hypothetical protein
MRGETLLQQESARLGLGYAFSDAVALIAARVAARGFDIALALGVGLTGYILVTYLRRRLSFRRLRNVPDELKRRLDVTPWRWKASSTQPLIARSP